MCRATSAVMLVLVLVLGGCGGQYILTVPDQLAPAGGETVTVIRLQRSEIWVVAPAVKAAPMRFRVGAGRERAAFTDKLGYAGVTVPVPQQAGLYRMTISLQDSQGEEFSGQAPVYVWDPDAPVVAVVLDCLPIDGPDAGDVGAALEALADKANILYMTRRSVKDHALLHCKLAGNGFPDGPILLWQRQRWHIVRAGRFKLPRVVVETRLVSQLAELRKTFTKLNVGVCGSKLAVKAFADAGMQCISIGAEELGSEEVTYLQSWSDLPGADL